MLKTYQHHVDKVINIVNKSNTKEDIRNRGCGIEWLSKGFYRMPN